MSQMSPSKNYVASIAAKILSNWNLGVLETNEINSLRKAGDLGQTLSLVLDLAPSEIFDFAKFLNFSRSQIGQDLFVLAVFGQKHKGFFVEFGATDGVTLSNTYMLEKFFGWQGILAEPNRKWHEELRLNRSSLVDTRCVFGHSGLTVSFLEAENGSLSTIEDFKNSDFHHLERVMASRYPVETVSLVDLLVESKAPREIDYLSVDTEGSEFEILRNFDFSQFLLNVVTVEHNFSNNRENIYKLLTTHEYVRVLMTRSRFDDWYIHRTMFEKIPWLGQLLKNEVSN